ncbi:hypothetical protein NDU88_011262 [Pleurodeles waltl]|uniref:Uncharacterized protein n=1 Tax=Pleurodeles waltl TaxID=8319 RepID=A0AAV7R0G8_PLEWA|nr:hypothetical protein NDU88_011261 [Pleurodeles waltl]KAJ1144970.1 hypothetical protein NDU88_011262 [Pleurodeles waltl]
MAIVAVGILEVFVLPILTPIVGAPLERHTGRCVTSSDYRSSGGNQPQRKPHLDKRIRLSAGAHSSAGPG